MKPVKFNRISSTPGRIRIYLPYIHKNKQYAENIMYNLLDIPGIKTTKANYITGKLLIIYDESVTDIDRLTLLINDDLLKRNRSYDYPVKFNIANGAAAITGYPIFKNAAVSLIKHKRLESDLLITAAVLTSILSGHGFAGLYILFLINLFNLLGLLINYNAAVKIKRLTSKVYNSIEKVYENREIITDLGSINIGDTIKLYSSDICPADGIVSSGKAIVDQSSATGEAIPVLKKPEDIVYTGTIIKAGEIELKITKIYEHIKNTVDFNTLKLTPVSNNSLNSMKLPQGLIKFYFAFSIIILALTRDFTRFAVMLASTYPYVKNISLLSIINPAVINAYKNGILIKNANSIICGAEVDTVVFDKTGTLTAGKPEIDYVIPVDKNYTCDDIISIAASSEFKHKHPLSEAILNEAKNRNLKFSASQSSKYSIGEGVSAIVENKRITIGSDRFMKKRQIYIDDYHEDAEILSKLGISIVYIAANRDLIGLIGFSDKLRNHSITTIKNLRYSGILNHYILTGDSYDHSFKVSQELGISNLYASKLLIEKEEMVKNIKTQHKVMMVGDGINDYNALKNADVSIVISNNVSSLPVEIGDIVLFNDNIENVSEFFSLSKRAELAINQNYIISTGINILAIGAASVNLITLPAVGILQFVNTLIIYFNSKRLIDFYRLNKGEIHG